MLAFGATARRQPREVGFQLEGAITAMIDLAQPLAKNEVDLGSVKVVAGIGFEPMTFRL
jgi:site-specific DNA recombinase